jgi:hypothetical protein
VTLLVEATTHTVLANSSFTFAINCCTFAFIAFLAEILSWSVNNSYLFLNFYALENQVAMRGDYENHGLLGCVNLQLGRQFSEEKNMLPTYIGCRTYNSSVPHI